jgi:SAM-dependent methyltransferase
MSQNRKRNFSEFRAELSQSSTVLTRARLREKRTRAGLVDAAAESAAVTRDSELTLHAHMRQRAQLPLLTHEPQHARLADGVHAAFVRQTLPYGGNGSLRPRALQRVLERMKMPRDAVFLDVGAGAGNVMLCALLFCGVKCAVGLEYDAPTIAMGRSIIAQQLKLLPPTYALDGRIELLDVDLTLLKQISPDVTHVYAYDRVMNVRVLANVAKLINALRPRVFVSFVAPAVWARHGLTARLFDQIPGCSTTGAQSFTAYLFTF